MRKDIISKRGYPIDIAGDELSLKIASYPATAAYLANRLQGEGKTVCELCCGIGVSLIELAKTFKHVIGVDNDGTILHDCQQNIQNAAVENFTLVSGDVSSPELLDKIQADVVLYDIPYWSTHEGRVDAEQRNPVLQTLVENIRQRITTNIVIYAPPSMEYAEMVASLGPCECVQLYTNGEYDRNLIFLGNTIEKIGQHRVNV